MDITFENLIDDFVLDEQIKTKLEAAVYIAMEYEEFGDDYDVCISLVSEEEIRRINFEHRKIDKVTDVLSFPQYDEDGCFVGLEDENIFIGDVVLCVQRAREQAKEYGHSFEKEMMYLTIHSILHLLGYDHEDEEDRKRMREREKGIIALLSERGYL